MENVGLAALFKERCNVRDAALASLETWGLGPEERVARYLVDGPGFCSREIKVVGVEEGLWW